IDALQLALGARADAAVVREGAARTEVVAEFEPTAAAREWLAEQGFEGEPGEPLRLKRQLDTQGRSRAWINGSAASATQLRELGELLLDIHGQHAWQRLTRPEAVRQLLDDYARIDARALRQLWSDWRAAQRSLEQARTQQSQLQQERERLQWQLTELDRLAPLPGEWEELNLQHGRLAHAQALLEAAQTALHCLSEHEASARTLLYRAAQALQAQQHVEPRYQGLAELLSSALAQVDDACHDLQQHAQRSELDPAALQALDQRLGLWLTLARRLRCEPQALAERLQACRQALAELERNADLAALEQAEHQAQARFRAEAERLSSLRLEAGARLGQAITQAMQGLGMAGGRFEVRLQALPEPQVHGLDQVEFLVAAHPGSTPRPVGKVASGGELSRIALAISVCTSEVGSAPTLIFDEVDSGIGGAVAHTVGQLMRRLGSDRQVLAVTHLAQVAACAHQHLRVSKGQDAHGSSSQIEPLDGAQRVAEVARMLGGQQLTDTTLAHAQELLCNSS
ncbi:MAG: DNA repair protein RecN, partial [Comamonadaceae bacterium]|nr:DNA repair protein RecN [Comamonadaceae bacterium]